MSLELTTRAIRRNQSARSNWSCGQAAAMAMIELDDVRELILKRSFEDQQQVTNNLEFVLLSINQARWALRQIIGANKYHRNPNKQAA